MTTEKDTIEDSRVAFTTLTFSNYKKGNVKKELLNALLAGKVENSCYWCAEMVCSGMLPDIWNIIISMTSEYINTTNVKLPIYVEKRYKYFRTVMQEVANTSSNELAARNNPKIRELFTELMCVLSVSKRKPKMPMVKLDPKVAFDMHAISERLVAPSTNFAKNAFRPLDMKELFISVNELAYHISRESRNCTSACYWIEWIQQFEQRSVKNNELCKCAMRTMPLGVADKYGNDVGWLIWEILEKEVKRREAPLLTRLYESLYFLYCFRYKPTTARKRRYIMYHVCYLLTEPLDLDQKIIENQASLQQVIAKCNMVYRQVKKGEVKDKMDYLKTII
jgi:hypothetical protein